MLNKQESLLRLQTNPSDKEALFGAALAAEAEGKRAIALHFYSQLIRLQPSSLVFEKIGALYLAMHRHAIAAIYYKAAADVEGNPNDPRLTQVDALISQFKLSNPMVVEAEKLLIQGNPSAKILREREKFFKLVRAGETQKSYQIGKKQYDKGQIDSAIQNVWASMAIRSGQPQEGLVAGFLALCINPSDWIAIVNIADILIQLRKANQVLDYAVAGVNLKPKEAVTWLNLSASFDILGKTWESIRASKRSIEINPKNAAAWTNLGNAYKNSGDMVKALPAFEQAVKIDPSNSAIWSNLLFGANYSPDYNEDQIAQLHFDFGRYWENRLPPVSLRDKLGRGMPTRLKVGFVSADLRAHPVAYFTEALWQNIDKLRIEVFIYDNFATEDQVTKRLKNFADHWTNSSGLNDNALLTQILNDDIDILVDMSGHTARNRLPVFARKPAPVQVTWLGHPNTSGLTRMDYRLTDIWLDPAGVETRHTEKLWRLPIHAVYAPLVRTPELRSDAAYAVNPTPALSNHYVTFGCCNNLGKISPAVITLWSRIILAVPHSKLLIEAPGLHQKEYCQGVIDKFAEKGVTADRLVLHDRVSTMQYIRYHEIDIALDPYPFGGGTTTCDLLWMGVPIISLVGERNMSRTGLCFVTACGHADWAAHSEEDYFQKATALASDIDTLNKIRLALRSQVENSPIMDGKAFARSLEDAFFEMARTAYKTTQDKTIQRDHSIQEEPMASASIPSPSAISIDVPILTPYEQYLQMGDKLMAEKKWKEAFTLFDGLRDNVGPEPNALFGAGLCCSNTGDYERAARFMADALLRRVEIKWLPWLAATYDKLGFSLPFYVLAFWLKQHHGQMTGVQPLFERAKRLMALEMEKRGLIYPDSIPSFDQAAAQKLNVQVVENLKANRNEQALTLGEQALMLYPFAQSLLLNTSLAAKRLTQYQKAGIFCLRSLAIDPLGYGAITNFGNLLVAANSPRDAMLLLESGSILVRDDPMLWGNLAVSYNSMRVAPWEAEFAARHALTLDQNVATTWSALSKSLSRQGRMAESLEASKKVKEIDPTRKHEDLFTIQYAQELDAAAIAQAHFEYGEQAEEDYAQYRKPWTNELSTDRCLRIGFVSGDFIAHPVTYFMEAIFEHLEHDNLFVVAYSNKPAHEEDDASQRIKAYIDIWRVIETLTDDQVDDLIRHDSIDILVDLSGHTGNNRLSLFARKPAPVQVTYIGHPNTTGLKTIDWRIVDKYTAPAELEPYYTEKLWRMPDAHCVYTPMIRNPSLREDERYAVKATPALTNGFITFGCCNNLSKISPDVITLWSRILLAIPTAKLLIEAPGLHQREFKKSFVARFEKNGLNADRLILKNRDTANQYLIYHDIDIALDPFPYNGGTTNCDLLWMSIPLITLPGSAEVSRLGLSFVSTIGHPDWAAKTPDEYVAKALELANDVGKLNETRLALRGEVERSPLMDGTLFAKNLEIAFHSMWRQYVESVITIL